VGLEVAGYREFIGTRLLAIAVLLPMTLFIALGVEGSAWWFLAAVAYPPAVLGIIFALMPPDRDDYNEGSGR
jgi:hypothetical protein